jgi:anti-anti-sigma regulatory factor
MNALELHTTGHGDPTVIAAIGPLTAHTTPTLHEYLQRTSGNDAAAEHTVLLDLSCCTNIDVDGLLGLDVAYQDAKRRGIDLKLARVPALIERLVRQRNFGHLLREDSANDHQDAAGEAVPAAAGSPAGEDEMSSAPPQAGPVDP